MTTKIKIGIVGATGYTGVELLRLLSSHPNAEVTAVTSRSEAGIAVADYFSSLRGIYDIAFQTPEDAGLNRCDLVFFATPNGVAMKEGPSLVEKGVRVIDLSADFRIRDIPTWEQWYKMTHTAPQLVSQAVTVCANFTKTTSPKPCWWLIRAATLPAFPCPYCHCFRLAV